MVGKKELKQTISWTLTRHGVEATVQLLDNLKELGFEWATRAGVSLGVEDLCVPKAKAEICDSTRQRTNEAEALYENGDITVVEKFLKVTGEWTKASEEVKDEAIGNFRKNDPTNPVYMMSTSGARGSISQVRQLIAMRGLMADANGELIEVPISNCLRDGMTVTDMLISGHGARKGVIDTALRTADSGYLYRRLDFAVSGTIIRAEDCGTTEAMDEPLDGFFQPAAPLQERIRGRVLGEDVLDPETGEVLFERGHLLNLTEAKRIAQRWKECSKAGVADLLPIRVRSPLTCKLRDGLCSKCYGEDLSTPGRHAKMGTPVGTIAAQSMGEPGTQLTMRTFHTGGAFEGGAGAGVRAALAGRVRFVTAASGEPIVVPGPGGGAGGAGPDAGQWRRTQSGDAACLLACSAKLQVLANGEVVQDEELQPGTLVKVQDGQAVSRGQGLFERGVGPLHTSVEDGDVEKLPKPILADEGGEVVVTLASAPGRCLPEGSSFVWVLQGSCASFEDEASCALSVRSGDIVAPGTPLATEWAGVRCAGVQRFQPARGGAGGPTISSEASEVAGWRHLDWRPQPPGLACSEEPAEEPDAKVGGAQVMAGRAGDGLQEGACAEDEVCLRTDFDWFFLTGGIVEYRASFALPGELAPRAESQPLKPKSRALAFLAAKEAQQTLAESRPITVSVCAFSPRSEAEPEPHAQEISRGSVGVVCSVPSRGTAGAICPVSRTAHPKHTVPSGGLVFHLPPEACKTGSRALLWAPEETHILQLSEEMFQGIAQDHGSLVSAGQQIPRLRLQQSWARRQPALTVSSFGCFCVYLQGSRTGRGSSWPSGAAAVAVAGEPQGVMRREACDRVCHIGTWKELPGQGTENAKGKKTSARVTVECVVKPGWVFACPSELLDSSWYTDAPAHEQGVCFHQKVIPPGVPFVPGLHNLISKQHWRVVEILDNPRAGPVCRVLVRLASYIEVPVDPEHLHPATARTLTSWYLPYAHGELVRSMAPVALAYEVVSSVSRWPGEQHSVTTVPVESPPQPPTRAVREPVESPPSPAKTADTSELSLELTREWPLGDICVVQHSPLGPSQRVTGDGTWSEPAPKYIPTTNVADGSTRPAGTGSTWQPTPRRQLVSPGGGYVCSATGAVKGSRNSVVTLGPADIVQVRCLARPIVGVGALLRAGEAISAADTAPSSGQVLLVEAPVPGPAGSDDGGPAATAFRVTLRRGRAYLVTPGGEVRVRTGSTVEQGDLLGTEALVVPRTTDIVQGLPKINKLFEAANQVLQSRLDALWEEAKVTLSDFEAAQKARRQLQQDFVSEVQSVYLGQGVSINSRHIEVVAMRMTSKCEVIDGAGLALQPGTLVEYDDVEALYALGLSREIRVRPLIRGVTVVGKGSHVMVSMGFREIDNIITEAVVQGPSRHPLQGIKENLMVGKAINVGTNASANRLRGCTWTREIEHVDCDEIPEWGSSAVLDELVPSGGDGG